MMRSRSPNAVQRTRDRSPIGRTSPMARGRSPRSSTLRDGSPLPSPHSDRRERRNSYSTVGGTPESHAFRRQRRNSVSPAAPQHSRRSSALPEKPGATSTESVRVILRVRPFNKMEEDRLPMQCPVLIPIEDETPDRTVQGVQLIERRTEYTEEHEEECLSGFQFDRVFYPKDLHNPCATLQAQEQDEVYSVIGSSCLDNLFDSFNSCILAYGQTGSGKTHTMMGGAQDSEGLIPRFCRDLLRRYEQLPPASQSAIKLRASFIEVYCEQLYDLMPPGTGVSKKKLAIRQHPVHGVHVAGAVSSPVSSWEDIETILRRGMAARSTAATSMNDVSSRSHAVFRITMEMQVPDQRTSHFKSNGHTFSTACIRFVDLAGSENLKKSGSDGARMQESIHINTSLLALRRIIDQLLESRAIPAFRDSKLTRLLSDCLGGNAKTWFLACVSPSELNSDETKNTLRYAAKASRIVNHVSRNMDVGARLASDLEQLREELSLARGGEVDELKALILQYETAEHQMQDDMNTLRLEQIDAERRVRLTQEASERTLREHQDEASRQIALAEENATQRLQAANNDIERARTNHSAEVDSLKQQLGAAEHTIERVRDQLREAQRVIDELSQANDDQVNANATQDAEIEHLKLQLAAKAQAAAEDKSAWEALALDMENDFAKKEERWKEIDAEREQQHARELEGAQQELTAAFKKQLKDAEDAHEEELGRGKAALRGTGEEKRRLKDDLVKQRVQHAADVAALEQQCLQLRRQFARESEVHAEQTDDLQQRFEEEFNAMRQAMEAEIAKKRCELAAEKKRHEASVEQERSFAEEARRRMKDAERRAANIESQFHSCEAGLRSMEEIHGKTQRILSAAEEGEGCEGSEELIALFRDVNSWGSQLKSLRTSFLSLSNHRGHPNSSAFLPSPIELTPDPSQGRHRRSTSSRRLRKM
ncbi:Kinesin-like protein K39 [Diplonema papillatum]|nr:Kinesin-like protein K39 [Diplonema papillatum]